MTRAKRPRSLKSAIYRLIVEAAPNAVVLVDKTGKIVLVNSTAERIFGYAREELLGRPVDILVPARFRSGHPAQRDGFFAAPKARDMGAGRDLLGLRKDGTEVPVEIGLSLLKTGEGTFAFAAVVDITERKKSEASLKESETRYRTLFDNMLNGLAYCRMIFEGDRPLDFVYLSVNKAFETQTGLKDVAGRKVSEVIPGIRESDPALFEVYGRVARTGKPEKFETYVKALQQWFDISVYSPRRNHFVVVFDVVTERKKAERLAQVEAANKELEAFSHAVAHDLRAPLRRISGFNDLLARGLGGGADAQSREYLKKISDNAAHMDALIDGLLKLSRVLHRELKQEAVDLTGVAARLAEELQGGEPQRRVQFVIAERVAAEGDPDLLEIVLRNLLENAWKFTSKHEQARIEFGATVAAGEKVYFVRDDGAGFDMAHADKIFSAFQRLHSSQEFPGTGIGLATVRRVIQRYGGRIWAEAAVERGATFYFTLGA